ncbi:hypothetical protein T4C_3967, partial [Trichinella pseudospiralis]
MNAIAIQIENMKRLLFTFHYGSEMDIVSKAVDEKMSTTLRVPRPSPILVLTTAQRCLTSQIGRDAVLSTWYDRRHLLCE